MISKPHFGSPVRIGSVTRRFLGAATFAMVAVVFLATAPAPTASAAAGVRPFSGVMDNINTVTGFAGPTQIIVEIEGELTATHLGRGGVSGLVIIDVATFGPGGCTELVEGIIDFTAANGSVLNMVMTANELCMDLTGELTFNGQYVITGGTGRFDGADGLIDVSGISFESLSAFVSHSVSALSGEISY